MIRPKKHLGQHFLKDENIAKKIVSFLKAESGNVLEIGPGTGILTKYLIKAGFKKFYAIEIDKDAVNFLISEFPEFSNNIIAEDFLKTDPGELFQDKFSIIGNFPYNISSQILFRVLDSRNLIDEVVGMFQKEVAERIASPPGNKKYGILSVLVQAFYNIEYLFTVSENVFNPPPNVKSAVIRLRRNKISELPCNEKMFKDVVKTAFNQRRKTLRNSLGKFQFVESDTLLELLTKRAEQLKIEDFVYLTQNLKS